MGFEKEKEEGEIIDAEIWYVYSYDLGLEVQEWKTDIEGFFNISSILAIIRPEDDFLYFKGEESLVCTKVNWEKKYFPKGFSFSKSLEFVSEKHRDYVYNLLAFRLSELSTPAFSRDFAGTPDYIKGILLPFYAEFDLGGESTKIYFEPFFRINYDGVLFLEYRLVVKNLETAEFINRTNLFTYPIHRLHCPLEIAIANQHLASISHGVVYNSKKYQKVMEAIETAEIYSEEVDCLPNYVLHTFEFEGSGPFFLGNLNEIFKYLFLRILRGKEIKKTKELITPLRSGFWQQTIFIVVREFEDQVDNNETNYKEHKELITKLFNRSCKYAPGLAPSLEANVRVFDDYLLFINPGLFLKVYNSNYISSIKVPEGGSRDLEFAHLDGSTLGIIEYFLSLYMLSRITLDVLLFSKKPKLKTIFDLKERVHFQKGFVELTSIGAGEVADLLEKAKEVFNLYDCENTATIISDDLMRREIHKLTKAQNIILLILTFVLVLIGITSFFVLLFNS